MKVSSMLVCLVAMAASVVAVAGDSDVKAFVSGNVLYGVVGDSVLKDDLASGSVAMHFPDGTVLEWNYPVEKAMKSALSTGIVNLSGRALADDGGVAGDGLFVSLCEPQAAAVRAAIQGVQASCGGGGGGSACSAALAYYNQASIALQECFEVLR